MTDVTFLMPNELTSDAVATSFYQLNATTRVTTIPIPLLEIDLPVIIFIWFEIIAAGITYGFGFIGNFLSLIIFFTQKEFRNVSTGVLFLLMTISNTIHLWTLTTEFLGTFNIFIYSNEFLQCRLNYFIQNVSRAVSTYLAIAITLDRLIRSEFPIRSRVICTHQNVIKLNFILIIIFSILYSFWFCPLNMLNSSTGTCYTGPVSAYTFFFTNIFLPSRLIIVCIVPAIIMSIANIRLLFNIRQSRRRVEQGNTTNGGAISRRMTSFDRMLIYMMLINVIAFLITQNPFHIYTVVQSFFRVSSSFNNSLIRAILLILSSVYFGIGFYFYCFASPLFREKFFILVKKIVYCRMQHQRN